MDSTQPSKSRLLVIGGSGRTGKLIVEEALRRGYPVTALARDPTSIEQREGLTVIQGSPLEQADVERAFSSTPQQEPSIIITALGQTRKSGNPWSAITSPPRLMANSTANLIKLGRAHNVQKLIALSMFGAGDSFSNLNFLMRAIMKWSNMSQTLEDQNLVDEMLRRSGVDFVMARPAMLKGEETAPVKFYGNEGQGAGFMPSISPKSVAVFMLDAAESDQWDGASPVITN